MGLSQSDKVGRGRRITLPANFKEGTPIEIVTMEDGSIKVSAQRVSVKPKCIYYLQMLDHLWKNVNTGMVVRLYRVYDHRGEVSGLISVPARIDGKDAIRNAIRAEVKSILKNDDFGILILNNMSSASMPSLVRDKLAKDGLKNETIKRYKQLTAPEEREYLVF